MVQTADGLFCTTIIPNDGLKIAAIIDLGCSTPLYVSEELRTCGNCGAVHPGKHKPQAEG